MDLNHLLQNQKRLAQKIEELQSEIRCSPTGELIITRNSKYSKWYVSEGNKLYYISKKKRGYAEKLAKKKFNKYRLDEMKQEMEALNRYLASLDQIENKSQYLLHDIRYMELFHPNLIRCFGKHHDWVYAEYKRNERHSENLIHFCKMGLAMRSKSEVIIANILYDHGIPFRYEAELEIGDIILYPDFTLMHPITEEIFYYEHFGMMDKPYYVDNCINKLHTYTKNQIIPGINLIMSFETEKHPINSLEIEKLILNWFNC